MIPEKKSESIINFLPPKVKKAIAGGMVAASLATGCNVLVDVPASEKPVEVSTGIPDKEPEKNVDPTQADYELIPTEKATETVINPTPTYTVEASGGEFTLVQDEMNQSEEALAQQNRIQRWLDYWVKFDNRPFAEESADIHWKYIYDNAKDPKEVLVLLEVGGEYNDSLFTVPMNEEGFVDFPPPVEGDNIEAGLGPLEIDPNKDGTILSVKDGVLVRKNSEGEVVERLRRAQWESVEKYPIDLEKLHNFPESYEYMVENLDEFVEAPDPLEDLGAFKEWVGKLEIIVGDHNNREVNYWAYSMGFDGEYFNASSFSSPNSLAGNPEIAYFEHNGEIHPILNINVGYDGVAMGGRSFWRTVLVILYNGTGSPEGREVISTLVNGGRIRTVRMNCTQDEYWPPLVNEAIEKGIVPTMDESNYNQITYGIGAVQTEEGYQKMINGN